MNKLNHIYHGDCLEVMKKFDDNSIDAIVTDCPYGLKFMNKKWDYDVPSVKHFEEMLRIAKSGSFLLCFGGSRTSHRIAVNIEDAGWEIRDTIMWIYGSGFPKSYNISKGIDKKFGKENIIGKGKAGKTALGQSSDWNKTYNPHEFNITAPATPEAHQWDGYGTALKPAFEPIIVAMKPVDKNFVNNALTHGVAGLNIDGSRIKIDENDNNHRHNPSRGNRGENSIFGVGGHNGNLKVSGRFPANIILDEDAGKMLDEQSKTESSRFFYTAKASKSERNAGCGSNNHPTVKPLKLMEYLCRLVKPPFGGVILDPYTGSGTTLAAANSVGWENYIGIEREKEYIEIAKKRIEHLGESE